MSDHTNLPEGSMPEATCTMPWMIGRAAIGALATAGLALLSGCATTGATIKSGVGDTFLEHAPYYAGARPATAVPAAATIGHWPVGYQRGGSHAAMFDPGGRDGVAVAALVAEMNTYLGTLGASTRMTIVHIEPGKDRVPPDVHFGCDLGGGDDCPERGDSTLGRRLTTMRLAVGRPSKAWVATNRAAMQSAGVERALVITLEVGQYWTRQRGLAGRKELELGTGHTAHLPWLTSLEAPVSVLQLTGALVDRDGRAVRIGAEGILARRSSIVESGLGLQRLITDEDVKAARTLRRDDLPGRPLAWQVALRNLVAGLTGVADVAAR